MPSGFPNSIDNFTNPLASSPLNSPSHAGQHQDLNDAVNKIETKLGVGNTVVGTYQAYTPTFSGFTLGNGVISAFFARANNLVHCYGQVTLGSTSSLSAALDVTLPVTAASGVFFHPSPCYFFNNTTIFWGTSIHITTTTIRLVTHNATGTYVFNNDTSGTVPFTWANGHSFYWNHVYRAA